MNIVINVVITVIMNDQLINVYLPSLLHFISDGGKSVILILR